ncbi:hypothetical protein ESCO_005612 [Escovopsis weberi]|uniref:Uncharacterized protein n=1 Tax=Escovopsis weberi TaxID=150374 RepID=A0A0M9VUF4_ESCWE|nr:hypothetical protein ESCO_005612 [Escovopsis weberi]
MDSSFHAEEDPMLHDHQANGRVPTPMQPTFAAQVRGQHCEWAGPGPALSNRNGVVNLGHHSSGFSNDQYVPRAVSNATEWQASHNHRRLPSPITEDDLSPEQAIGSLAMMLDEGNNMAMIAPEVLALAAPHRTMDHPNAMMDIESSPTHHMDVERDSPSPGSAKKGHVRSKHTIDSWTWQPGMKKSFSIGYRADCEKCRLKVPGHFNHIVIS